jgi:hypothetical protein
MAIGKVWEGEPTIRVTSEVTENENVRVPAGISSFIQAFPLAIRTDFLAE